MAKPQSHPSGWITRDYKEDGSFIEARTKDIDVAFVYIVVLFCSLIAMGGIIEQQFRLKPPSYLIWSSVAVIAGLCIIGFIAYRLWASTLVVRLRLDERGILLTVGKSLKAKMPWRDVLSVRCYEREGGITMGKTIRGIEFAAKNSKPSLLPLLGPGRGIIRVESDIWGQETLDKTVHVIQFYERKFGFQAKMEEWEQASEFMFSQGQE